MKKDSKKKIIIGLIIVIFIFMLIIVAMLIPKMFGRLKGDILSVTTSDLPNIDSNFYNCIRESYRNDTGNNISSSYVLSSSELASINSLSCTNVTNATALKYMTGLTGLEISNSKGLTNLELNNNTLLSVVNLSNLSLKSLDLRYNTHILSLDLDDILSNSIDLEVGEIYEPVLFANEYISRESPHTHQYFEGFIISGDTIVPNSVEIRSKTSKCGLGDQLYQIKALNAGNSVENINNYTIYSCLTEEDERYPGETSSISTRESFSINVVEKTNIELDVPSNSSITDKKLYNCVRTSYMEANNLSTLDNNHVFTDAELATIKYIDCENVSNASALRYMTGLTELRITNSLSLNDIDLSNNLNLVTIVLSDLNLRSLDVSKNTKAVGLQIFNILRDTIEVPVGETYTPIKLAPKYSNNGYDMYYDISGYSRGDVYSDYFEISFQNGICDVTNRVNPSLVALNSNGGISITLYSDYCNNPGGKLETSNWKYAETIKIQSAERSIPEDLYQSLINGMFAKYEAGTKVSSLLSISNNVEVTRDGSPLTSNDTISTGDFLIVNGLPFEIAVSGDLNYNGVVTISDVTMAYAHVKNKITLEGSQIIAADYNGNNIITVSDVSALYSMSKSN